MRNLKRALSLALASVMLMGMMVVGTSAKGLDDFGDTAEIVNQDAVAVTSEIGIFDGYEDGEFKPENVVTRAEMAVIICKMLYGADVSVSQFAETSVFTDVPAWAEGYVNLCASLGIVAGVGDNKFDPNATVTTAQAAMMLTKALGYFQSARDFGDSWVLAATAKATELGLYGDLKLTAAAGLTRDNVAEMVFNTLTKAVPVQYNELLGVYYNENQGIIYSLQFNYLQTLGYKNFDLVYKTQENTEYGRPATTWGFGSYKVNTNAGDTSKTDELTEEGGLISSYVRMLDKDQIITVAMTPDYVYTANTAEKDVFKDLGAAVCNQAKGQEADEEYEWTAYINGTEQVKTVGGTVVSAAVIPAKNNTDKYVYTDKGSVTEIYIDDYTQEVTVVEINYYLGEVTATKDNEISVKALSKEPKLDNRDFATSEFAKGDLVAFTVDTNDEGETFVAEVMAPEVVTGEVKRVEYDVTSDNAYLKLADGSKHEYAAATHNVYDLDNNAKAHPELNREYNLYLTPAGYVLGYALAEEVETNYLYVKDSDEEMGDWSAKVILADGTTHKVDLAETYVENGASDIDIIWVKNQKGDATTDGHKDTNATTNIDGHVYEYTVNSAGEYTLFETNHICADWDKYVTDKDGSTDITPRAENAQIHNGKAYIKVGDDDVIVDRDTVFVDTMNDKVYTGYDEVPNVDNAFIAYAMNRRVADIVFILDGEIYDENSVYFVLTDDHRESLKSDRNFWDHDYAYVNGHKQNIIVRYDALRTWNGVTSTWDPASDMKLKEGVLYRGMKTNDEGYFTEVREIDSLIDGFYGHDVYEVGNEAFWIDLDDNTSTKTYNEKFDTDNETTYVVVEQLYKADGTTKDGFTVYEGSLNSMIVGVDNGYETKADVVVKDEEYAKLVYIWLDKAAVDPSVASIDEVKIGSDVVDSYSSIADAKAHPANVMTGTAFSAATATVTGVPTIEVSWDDGANWYPTSSGAFMAPSPYLLKITATSVDGTETVTEYVAVNPVAYYTLTVDNNSAKAAKVTFGGKTFILAANTGLEVVSTKLLKDEVVTLTAMLEGNTTPTGITVTDVDSSVSSVVFDGDVQITVGTSNITVTIP